MSDNIITLFLADDHQLVVEGLIALVGQDPCMQIVGCSNNGLDVLKRIQEVAPDVLVLDVSLPGLNGLDVCRQVKKMVLNTAILILTMHNNEQCVLEALESGALGYLAKEAMGLEFREAVHAVARGDIYLGRTIPISVLERVHRHAPDPYTTLSDRQRQVLQLFAEGRNYQQIAEVLGVTSAVVQDDYDKLVNTLGLTTQADVVKFAIRRHIVTAV